MRRPGVLVAAGLALSLSSALKSQAADPGFSLEAEAGYQDLTEAKQAAEAVFNGSSGGFTWGGGLRYVHKSGVFVTGWYRSFSKDGQRVYVASAQSPVFPLGHPLSVHIQPLQGTIGYRFSTFKKLTPYIGAGAGANFYHEQSTVGGVTATIDETKACYHGLLGLEVGRGMVRFAAEAGYTAVPNAIGVGGVSRIYGETGIGGYWAVGKVLLTSSARRK